MQKKEWIAMILAGGQGSRLGILTRRVAKPAVPFGGKYRIIDFPLSNCHNSGIDTVGILTQYRPMALHSYIGTGTAWDLDRKNGGVYTLPPFAKEHGGEWYRGTADAIYQNHEFIDMFDPSYVAILSGDHIYKMDYSLMLEVHKRNNADATIAVMEVPWEEASRFGIMATDEEDRIVEFAEKPKQPKSNLASMGVYIFTWSVLRRYLFEDAPLDTDHDFGKNIIPTMLNSQQRMFAYRFKGYWKDVGTIDSLWEANMDLLADVPNFNLYDENWRIYSVNPTRPPHYVGERGQVIRSLINEGCQIFGQVENSVLFPGVYVGPGAKVKDSVIMSNAHIGAGANVDRAIIARKASIGENSIVGLDSDDQPMAEPSGIVVIGETTVVPSGSNIKKGAVISNLE